MRHVRKIIALSLILFLIPSVFSALMIAEEANEYFSNLSKANAEVENKCIKAYYASEYNINSEADYGRLTVNIINVASLKCATDPCTWPCREDCCDAGNCTLDCIGDCEAQCHKPKREACNTQCAGYGGSVTARWEQEVCGCVCGTNAVIYNGQCLSESDAKVQGYDPQSSNVCVRNTDCESGICVGGKCEGVVSDLGCYTNYDCDSGFTCVSNECVKNEGCTDNSDCLAMQECINKKCVAATGELDLIIDKKVILMNAAQEVKLTAKISGARSGYVTFELNDPQLIFSYGTISITKTINSNGVATATIKFPNFSDISEMKTDYFPYTMNVKASANIAEKNKSDSGSIQLKSPAPKITSVTITPSPVESYKKHTVVVKAEDEDDSSLTYTLLTTGDNLGKDGTATKSSVITQAGGKTLTANIYGDEFGFNMAEIEAARNVGDTLKGGAISAGASLTKKGLDQAAIQLAIKGAVKTGNKLLRWIPIVGTGKTIYGLYGSGKNAGDILANVGYSANWKEAMYNSLNLGAEGLRFTAGAFDLVVGEVPLIGQLSDLTQDAIDVGLGAGQVYLKSKALEARSLSAEGKESVGVVTVVVEDGDGYKDKYVYVYAEKYYYVGWDAE